MYLPALGMLLNLPYNHYPPRMDVKFIVHLRQENICCSNELKNIERPLLFMTFYKPKSLALKPPDKIRKIYLNRPGY
jgi:hypothetical protein